MDDSVELAEKLLEDGSLDRLVQALGCRLVIGQGMGIAMERHQLDEDQALQFLAFEASAHGVTVREAAQRLIDGCNAETEPLDPHGLSVRRVTRFPRLGAGRTA
jgi:AmiR/NasT family two-component response regulator